MTRTKSQMKILAEVPSEFTLLIGGGAYDHPLITSVPESGERCCIKLKRRMWRAWQQLLAEGLFVEGESYSFVTNDGDRVRRTIYHRIEGGK